ncbi:hypothetical protein JCM18918_758 [Cutibacterium acnes JCM 18918]|nr:hypothetical protein JCM18918_758 [Cutibacterium acnes JCM 18918]
MAPSLFWGFNLGLLLTIAMLVVHGMIQVNGHPDASPVISGIAGLGHIGLSVGLVGSWWPCSHHFQRAKN